MALAHSKAAVPQSLAHRVLLTSATITLAAVTQATAQPRLFVQVALQSSALMALASKTECSARQLQLATHPHQSDALTWLVLLLLLLVLPLMSAHKAVLLAKTAHVLHLQLNAIQSLAHHTSATSALMASVLLIQPPVISPQMAALQALHLNALMVLVLFN
jgi:hypothetical protein